MTQVTFGSTYRIQITQAGINAAKKEKLRELTQSYHGLIGKGKGGYARVSIPDFEDNKFIAKLKGIGYKVFQKFEGENIPNDTIDAFIKQKLDKRDYNQLGKSMKRLSRKMREQRRYESSIDAPKKSKKMTEQEKIEQERNLMRQSPQYLELVKEEGVDFAEAVYFGIY